MRMLLLEASERADLYVRPRRMVGLQTEATGKASPGRRNTTGLHRTQKIGIINKTWTNCMTLKFQMCVHKILCHQERGKPQTRRKCSQKNIPDKGLICRIYKELLPLNNKKTTNPIFKKWPKTKHFMKDMQMTTISTSESPQTTSVTKKTQIKTTMKYHPILTRMAIIKN